MTIQLSENATMARRLLAMFGSEFTPDPGLGTDGLYQLLHVSDILEAAGCSREVTQELETAGASMLNENIFVSQKECVEAIRWTLEKTRNATEVLRVLAYRSTLYFISKDGAGSLFEKGQLAFFEDFCSKLSMRQRLELADEALQLVCYNSRVRPDMLHFAMKLLLGIKFDDGSPAFHRRNLLCGALECIISDDNCCSSPQLRKASVRDATFGVRDMIRQIARG